MAHVAVEDLLGRSDRFAWELVAELERTGLITAEVLERLACDANIVLALDDEAGHTMCEGRARRFPTETQRRELWRRDRHCRFPGCANAWFTHAHHIVPWSTGGLTDADNLVTLCTHHHHELHSKRWSVSGDANAELTFIGPGGRLLCSRPSPLWGTIGVAPTAGARPRPRPRPGPGPGPAYGRPMLIFVVPTWRRQNENALAEPTARLADHVPVVPCGRRPATEFSMIIVPENPPDLLPVPV